MAKHKPRRLIRLEVELSCEPGMTKAEAKRELRQRINAFNQDHMRHKRAK